MENKNIVWKYIITLSLVFGVLLLGRVYFDKKHHETMFQKEKDTLSENLESRFQLAQSNLIDKYTLLTNYFMYQKEIYDKFKYNKRDELYSLLEADYLQFKAQDKNLYVMHFFDTKNKTILRMHKPDSYGDDLTKKRPIVVYANKTQQNQTGFEVGKNGTVYRITTPFIYHNEHIGVLEFGIKPNYFIDMLKREFDIQAITIVKSDFLNNLDFKKQYPKIDNYSIVTKDPIVEKIKSSLDLNIDRQIIDVENKTYLVLSDLNLLSFNNQIVSKIIIIKDITNFVKENNNALMFINSLTFMVFLLVLSVIYIVLTKFYKEIEEHTQTISTLHKESKFLQNKANTDDLTKAFNKRYFDQFLVEFLDTNKAGVIIFFDIDHFKNINDTHGHLVGDKILTKLSATVKEYLREDDIFVRWGGEEFIVLIEDITPTIGVKKAEELRKLVEKTLFANELKITISLGVTMIEKNDTKEKLLKRVDTLLYKAKDSGRNCVVSD